MGAELIGYFPHGSPEWQKARMDGLGGSEIAAVLSLSKFDSHFALWHRKQGRIPDPPTNPDMEWGTRLEPAILGKFRERHPELVVPKTSGTWRSAERPWQIANPDGLAHARGRRIRGPVAIVEAKNVNTRIAWEWDDGPPPYYLLQVRWYLDVFDLQVGYLAVLFGGSEYREYEVHPDPEDTALMWEAGEAFMRSLETGQRPSIDSHGATYDAIRQLPDGLIDDKVEIDEALALEYVDTLLMANDWQTRKTLISSKVLDAIGNYRGATHNGRTIAVRALKRGTNTTHALLPTRQD